jgi:hypothetical protein
MNTNTSTSINNIVYDMIIDKNKLESIVGDDDFKNINLVRIFGKGPSFKNIEKIDKENEFHIGINQTVNILTDVDMLVINDLENIYLIHEDKLKNLKYILTPEYLHINQRFNINGYFVNVYEYLKQKKFTGKYIVYNLGTNRNPNPNYITLPSTLTSSNSALDFVCIFLNKYIKNIEFYGVGLSGKNYHKLFTGNGTYNINRIHKISNHIKKTCELYKINYVLK